MNKRGSHIGVIVSFIIFIGMIVFLYAILAPTISVGQNYQSAAGSLQSALEANISGNVTSISFYANDSGTGCILLSGFVSATNLTLPLHLLVSDSSGVRNELNVSSSSSDDVYMVKTNSGAELLNAYNSPYFNQTLTGTPSSCTTLSEGTGSGTYRIGQIKTETYALETLIINLMKNYNDSYQSVKTYFEVPEGFDFGFKFTYQNGTTIGPVENIPESANVYSQSTPLTYITLNGSEEPGELILNLWQ